MATRSIRSRRIEILAVHDANRVIAFRRGHEQDEVVVLASFNDKAFSSGYRIAHNSLEGKRWRKVLDSDSAAFGGAGTDAAAIVIEGDFDPAISAAGLVVFRRDV